MSEYVIKHGDCLELMKKIPSNSVDLVVTSPPYDHNDKYKDRLKEILQYELIREYVKSISMKKISVARLYMYIKDNIDGIE